MSQAKVDRYKEEKKNRKEIIAKEKRQRMIGKIAGWVVILALIGWIGYSAVDLYLESRPMETVYTDLTAINDYMTTLNTAE